MSTTIRICNRLIRSSGWDCPAVTQKYTCMSVIPFVYHLTHCHDYKCSDHDSKGEEQGHRVKSGAMIGRQRCSSTEGPEVPCEGDERGNLSCRHFSSSWKAVFPGIEL